MEKTTDRDSLANLSTRCSSCGLNLSQHEYCNACGRTRACGSTPPAGACAVAAPVDCRACSTPAQ